MPEYYTVIIFLTLILLGSKHLEVSFQMSFCFVNCYRFHSTIDLNEITQYLQWGIMC